MRICLPEFGVFSRSFSSWRKSLEPAWPLKRLTQARLNPLPKLSSARSNPMNKHAAQCVLDGLSLMSD